MGSHLINCQSCCPVSSSQYAGTDPSMQKLLSHSSVHKLDATLSPPPHGISQSDRLSPLNLPDHR